MLCKLRWKPAPFSAAILLSTPGPDKTGRLATVPGFWPLFLAVAVALLGLGVISPVLPLYMRAFGAGGLELGLVFAAFAVARFLGGPLFGRLSDRVARKPLILTGLGLYALVSVAYALAQSLWQIGLLRLVQGLASTLVTPQAQAYVAERTPPGREGRTLNLFYTAQFVGMGLGPILGGGLAEHFGLTAPFYAMGLLTVAALWAVALLVPMEGRAPGERRRPRPPWRAVLAQRELWAIVAYMGTRGFWRQAFNAFFPLLAAEKGLGETMIGTVLTLYFVGESVFQIPAGYLADLLPPRPQVLLGGMLATVPLFFVPVVTAPWAVALLSLLMGVASAFGRGSIIVVRTQLGRRFGMGTVTGVQDAAFASGQSLGPTLAGAAYSLAGAEAPLFLSGCLGLLGALLAALLVAPLPAKPKTCPRCN